MKITKFKFKNENYTNDFLPILIKRINIFGLIYLIQYVSFGLTNVLINKSNDTVIQNEINQIIQHLINLEFHPYCQFIKTENILIGITISISFLPEPLVKPNKSLINFFSFLENEAFISQINIKVPFFDYVLIPKAIPINKFLLNSFDIENKIIPFLIKNLKNKYILVKDKSSWGGLNWYAIEYHTRGNTFFKYVIPFYRSIKRSVFAYHILICLKLIKFDEFSHFYVPTKYESFLKDFVELILKKLSIDNNFLISNNFITLDNKYYLWNKRLIDLDFNLFQLNTNFFEKGLITRPIIRKCLKNL